MSVQTVSEYVCDLCGTAGHTSVGDTPYHWLTVVLPACVVRHLCASCRDLVVVLHAEALRRGE